MAENTKIGSLWTKKTRNGGEFLAGVLEYDGKKERIVVFKVREKKSEKSPDYTINLDTWKPPERNAQVAEPVRQIVNTFDSRPAAFDDDSIPF